LIALNGHTDENKSMKLEIAKRNVTETACFAQQ
jgi:hypothetical protein